MLELLIHSRTAWNDHFPATNPTTFNSILYTSRHAPSGTNIYVSNCLFRSMTSSSYGGALYSTSATYFLVESSSFFSCKTSDLYGGAIYFSNTNGGQSVLYKVCGYDCVSTYTGSGNTHGQCVYIIANNAASSKNYIVYSSFVRSVNDYSRSWFTVHLNNGNISCTSANISLHRCYGDIIYYRPFSDSNYVTCSISYSSITDNIVPGYTCFYLPSGGAKHEIKSCNILRNKQGPNTQGTIAVWGNMMIEDSCILENNATYVFYTSSSYRITISNCTVDSTSNNGYLITQNTVTKSFVLALNLMSTQNCHSGYDSAGTLTPIIQTPSSSPKKKIHYTCERLYYKNSQVNFFSSAFVLIFNFIHTFFF
jgi:hypothetical protein